MSFAKQFVCLALLCAFTVTAGSQTVIWSVPPADAAIESLNDRMYVIRDDAGKVSAYRYDGTQVSRAADSITAFSEGLALVLNREGSNYRIQSFLSEDGLLISPEQDDIYAGEYAFFSEGLLPAHNRKGQYGFVNNVGREVVDFDYTSVHPFSEGFAAVGKNNGFFKRIANNISGSSNDYVIYIDLEGDELRLDKAVGRIQMGTSFYKDEALVRTQDGRYCFIDKKGRLLREIEDADFTYDWKFRLVDNTEPIAHSSVYSRSDIVIAELNGLWGYKDFGGKWIVPPQFITATPFNFQGFAVVGLKDGQYGILKLIEGSYHIAQEAGALVDNTNGKESVAVTVTVPDFYKTQRLFLDVIGEDFNESVVLASMPGSDARVQILLPPEERVYCIRCDRLILYEKEFCPITPNTADLEFKINKKSARANADDYFYIDIIVSNSGKRAFKGDISIKGRGFVCSTNWLDIDPSGMMRISGYFTKVIKRETRSIVIKVGDREETLNVYLVPFIG